MSIAICLLLFYSFFVSPALPLSVSFSLSFWSEGGRKQTQIKAQAALVQRFCVFVCRAHDRNKRWCKEQLLRMCFVLYVLLAFPLPLHYLPSPPLSPAPSCSYSTTSNILIHTATPRQVGGCGPGVATGEEGKYQRRSGRGGAGEVEGKPNQ